MLGIGKIAESGSPPMQLGRTDRSREKAGYSKASRIADGTEDTDTATVLYKEAWYSVVKSGYLM